MKSILLKVPFSFDHCEIPAGAVIAVPPELAEKLIQRNVATAVGESAGYQHAVIEIPEKRIASNRRAKHKLD
jgi:hypothetical protein